MISCCNARSVPYKPVPTVERTSVQLKHDKVTSCRFAEEIGIGFLAKDARPSGLRSHTILGRFGYRTALLKTFTLSH